MPYIHVNVSVEPTKEEELKVKEGLGRIIEMIPGKSEAFLMVQIQSGCHLYFGGNQDAETSYIKVEAFGGLSDECCLTLTQNICKLMEEALGIPQNRTYITYEGLTQWGWNSKNF